MSLLADENLHFDAAGCLLKLRNFNPDIAVVK